MYYTTVVTYTTKLRNEVKSDCLCCAERRLIKNLKHDFFKKRVSFTSVQILAKQKVWNISDTS